MKVSIIIPCVYINERAVKCIRECLNLNYDDLEVIVLPDKTSKKSKDDRLRIIETGKVKPGVKRNIGMEDASGELFAFIDDDAYPNRDWLKNVVKYFEDDNIGIVGGPNLIPDLEEVNFAERVSDGVLRNYLALGPASVRYKVAENRYVRELPSCNFISRNVGIKFDPKIITAEDSKYCFEFIDRGYKVLYARDVIVKHHRRDNLWNHVKQMYTYGRDIAMLARKKPKYDRIYFSFPTIGMLVFIGALFWSFFNPFVKYWFGVVILVYLLIMFLSSLNGDVKIIFHVWIISIVTHFAYGIGWLIGKFGREESEKVKWNSR